MTALAATRAVFAALVLLVTFLTLTPNVDPDDGGVALTRMIAQFLFGTAAMADKVAHFLAYGALGFFAGASRLAPVGRSGYATIGLAAYGVGLEALQGLGGVRSPELVDAVANAAGAAAGGAAHLIAAQLFARARS